MTNGESLLSKFGAQIILGLIGLLITLLGWMGRRHILIMDKHGDQINEINKKLSSIESKVDGNIERLDRISHAKIHRPRKGDSKD